MGGGVVLIFHPFCPRLQFADHRNRSLKLNATLFTLPTNNINQKTFHVTTLKSLVRFSFFSWGVHNVGLESLRSPTNLTRTELSDVMAVSYWDQWLNGVSQITWRQTFPLRKERFRLAITFTKCLLLVRQIWSLLCARKNKSTAHMLANVRKDHWMTNKACSQAFSSWGSGRRDTLEKTLFCSSIIFAILYESFQSDSTPLREPAKKTTVKPCIAASKF